MKYYLYIADSKVDMLLAQIPSATQAKIAAELKFNLGILSGKVGTERQSLDNRVSRLRAVEKYLRNTAEIGELFSDTEWVSETAMATIVTFREGVVFFFGQLPGVSFGLGGSLHHVIGNLREGSANISYSFLPYLLEKLAGVLPNTHLFGSHQLGEILNENAPKPWPTLIWEAARLRNGPEQKIEFLARRLTGDVEQDDLAVLATPLYVALAE
jgi:hypothetical protein